MNEVIQLTPDLIKSWIDDATDSVALHLKQRLVPIEGENEVIYPPTYADIGYNYDTLSDGVKVVTIDSVGSQANRMEPIFKRKPYSDLVPQIAIKLRTNKTNEKSHIEKISIFDLAHRSADAVVHGSPTLSPIVSRAFWDLKQEGNARGLCCIAPTSLVFGFWDSRGKSNEKRPRLVRSIIRAWDIELLQSSAQFNSIWKFLDESQQTELNKIEKQIKTKNFKLSKVGLKDAPAVNLPGGVMTKGPIERNITINLVALRSIYGSNTAETSNIRQYLLALTLLAATSEIDLNLREGCHLCYTGDTHWTIVNRRGESTLIDLTSTNAQKNILTCAKKSVKPFRKDWPKLLVHEFNMKEVEKYIKDSLRKEELEE